MLCCALLRSAAPPLGVPCSKLKLVARRAVEDGEEGGALSEDECSDGFGDMADDMDL